MKALILGTFDGSIHQSGDEKTTVLSQDGAAINSKIDNKIANNLQL